MRMATEESDLVGRLVTSPKCQGPHRQNRGGRRFVMRMKPLYSRKTLWGVNVKSRSV